MNRDQNRKLQGQGSFSYNKLLGKLLVIINAYHVATLNSEQAKVYDEIILKSGLFDFLKEDEPAIDKLS